MEYNWQITISEVPTRGSKANRADAWIVRHTQITVLRKQSGTEGRELIGKKKRKEIEAREILFLLLLPFILWTIPY